MMLRYATFGPLQVPLCDRNDRPLGVAQPASVEEEMEATLYYARRWSLGLDMKILAQTVAGIIKARGVVTGGYARSMDSISVPKSFSASA